MSLNIARGWRIRNGCRASDFVYAGGSVALNEDGRKRFIATVERRIDEEVTHPDFGYRLSYRRLFELQARLLGRHLHGELVENPNFITREMDALTPRHQRPAGQDPQLQHQQSVD